MHKLKAHPQRAGEAEAGPAPEVDSKQVLPVLGGNRQFDARSKLAADHRRCSAAPAATMRPILCRFVCCSLLLLYSAASPCGFGNSQEPSDTPMRQPNACELGSTLTASVRSAGDGAAVSAGQSGVSSAFTEPSSSEMVVGSSYTGIITNVRETFGFLR